MISAPALALAAATVFVGGVLQGIVGFGMGLFTVGLMLRLIPLHLYAPLNIGLALCMNALLFSRLRKNADWRIIAPLILGSLLGLYPGTCLPALIPSALMRKCVGVFITLSGLVLWSGWKCDTRGFVPRMGVGVVSGLLAGSISVSAPPVAIFLSAGATPKHIFRASTASFFLVQNAMAITAFGLRGALTGEYFKLLACLVPAVLAGTAAGARIAGRVNERLFHRAVMVLILISGITLLF